MTTAHLFEGFDELFKHLAKVSVGYEPIFREFKSLDSGGYPPHNIYKKSDTEFVLEIAVAGFKRDEIEIEEHDKILTVRASKKVETEVDNTFYLHKGIAARSFIRKVRVADHLEVADAKLEDGILSIIFTLNVPNDIKPRQIPLK